MSAAPQLERYLSELEKSLSSISTSERADILIEIKSHVLEAQERDPSQSLDALLASLGEPSQVANRYLMERGINPAKPPKRLGTVVKWLTIGFLGTVGLCLLAIIVLVSKFSPLVHVDERTNHVVLLGGLIDVNAKDVHHLSFDGDEMGHVSADKSIRFQGNFDFHQRTANIKVPFTNGKVDVMTSDGEQKTFSWDCKTENRPNFKKPEPTVTQGNHLSFDLTALSGVKCSLRVPKDAAFNLEGDNGKVSIADPRFNASVKIGNGLIEFSPEANSHYNVSTHVSRGMTDDFPKSEAKDAYKVSFEVTNGKISNARTD